jgi:hypothetical protein
MTRTTDNGQRQSATPFRFTWERAVMNPTNGLSTRARHLALTLATFGNIDGTSIFPTNKTLARAMGISVETVMRAKRELIAAGLLIANRRFHDATEIALALPDLESIVTGDTHQQSLVTDNQITYQTQEQDQDLEDQVQKMGRPDVPPCESRSDEFEPDELVFCKSDTDPDLVRRIAVLEVAEDAQVELSSDDLARAVHRLRFVDPMRLKDSVIACYEFNPPKRFPGTDDAWFVVGRIRMMMRSPVGMNAARDAKRLREQLASGRNRVGVAWWLVTCPPIGPCRARLVTRTSPGMRTTTTHRSGGFCASSNGPTSTTSTTGTGACGIWRSRSSTKASGTSGIRNRCAC